MIPIRLPGFVPKRVAATREETSVGNRAARPVSKPEPPTDRSRYCAHLLNRSGELVGGVTAYPTANGYACEACR